MRIARIGDVGRERPAVLHPDGTAVFVDDLIKDWNPAQIAAGAVERVAASDWAQRPGSDVGGARVGSPLASTTKIVCIGLNYRDHAVESGMEIPTEPIVFMKAPDCLSGPNDDVLIPPTASELDYEAELAVVIGKRALCLGSPDKAREHILGYTVSQDISERGWQLRRGGQWTKGKSFPSFNPLGPVIVTAGQFDPGDVAVSCAIDGEVRQNGRTRDLIFAPDYLVWYVSQFMQLLPGDVISTGTPAGVGMANPPARYLKVGHEMVTQIEGIGRMASTVVAYGGGRGD